MDMTGSPIKFMLETKASESARLTATSGFPAEPLPSQNPNRYGCTGSCRFLPYIGLANGIRKTALILEAFDLCWVSNMPAVVKIPSVWPDHFCAYHW